MKEKIIEKLARHEFLIVCIIGFIMFIQFCSIFLAVLFGTKNKIIGISLGISLIILIIFYIVWFKVDSFNNKKSDTLEVFEEDDKPFDLIKTFKNIEMDKIDKIIVGLWIFGVLSLFITIPISVTFPDTYLFCVVYYFILINTTMILAVIDEILSSKK